MASPTPKRPPTPRQHPPLEIVSPLWLLKAIAITIAIALICAYLTLCLLVYQGQWQLLLHPDTNPSLTTTLPVQTLRFGASETGQPSLAGLWLPAAEGFPANVPTILFLPDGSGRLADDLPTLTQLHQLPVNIFAFDYRGFGTSNPSAHPSEARMAQDAATALDFLINTRHIPSQAIIPYGVGLGASLATNLCLQHPELPALILESPVPSAYTLAASDSRTHFVALHLLFHERFEIAAPLKQLQTPKLFLTAGPSHSSFPPDQRTLDSLSREASTPSYTAHLTPWNPLDANPAPARTSAYRESILRFLNEYLPAFQPAQGPTP